MAWARFDDMFPWSRKVRRTSDAAFRLHVSGIVACARDLTDGVLTQDDLDDLPPMRGLPKRIDELVTAGLWHIKGHRCHGCVQPPADGWVIHDYLDYNPTKADVEAEKAAARERQRRRRLARAGVTDSGDVTPDVTRDQRRESQGVSQTPSLPDPSLPDPSHLSGSNKGGNSPKQAVAFAPQPCGKEHDPARSCGACAKARRDEKTKDAEEARAKAARIKAIEKAADDARKAEAAATPPDDGTGATKALEAVKQALAKEEA